MSGENPTTDGAPGLDFSPYRLLRRRDGSPWRLGAGAMGVTYKAFDERLRVDVALKVIAPVRLEDARARALFLREARSAARVRHENVAAVTYLHDDPANIFLVMEFVAGESLEKWRREREVIVPLVATEFAIQIARGLGAIHAQQIVHRDLKPANLMIGSVGTGGDTASRSDPAAWRVKVIDFGLARAYAATGLETQAGAPTLGFVGTAAYASPEQCVEHDEIDGRSDLYSLGCILWEMLTGAPPFRAATQRQLIHQQITQLPPLSRITYLPRSLVAILSRLLAKDPNFRFADAASAAVALERCRDRLASGAEATDEKKRPLIQNDVIGSTGGSTSAATARRPRLGTLVPFLGAAALISLVAGGWFWWPGPAEGRSVVPLGSPRLPPGDRRTIAVLPFANLSSGDENEALARTMQQDVLASLAQMPGLKVKSRTATRSSLSADRDLRRIAGELGAGALLEGSVRRSGERIRVTVQLIDPVTGQNLWAEAFDRDVGAAREIPDRIARDVASTLLVEPAPATRR